MDQVLASVGPPNQNFVWLTAPQIGSVRVALYRSDRMARNTPLLDLFRRRPWIKEIVLCSDERSLAAASKEYSRYPGIEWFGPPPGSKVRGVKPIPGTGYRLAPLSPESQDYVMYLNYPALDTTETSFIVDYASEFVQQTILSNKINTGGLDNSVAAIEWRMQTELGFPFAVVTDYIRHIVQFMRIGMLRVWAEHSALERTVGKADSSAISKFVNRRIDLLETGFGIHSRDIGLHGSFYQIFHFYTLALGLCMALPSGSVLRSSALLRVDKLIEQSAQTARRRSLTSLANAIDVLRKLLAEQNVFESKETYESTLPAILEESGKCLKAEFVDLTGSMFLLEEALSISMDLSLRPDQIREQEIHWFLELCDLIAANAQGYQLAALIASRMKLQVLVSLGYYIGDPLICSTIEKQTTENLKRFEGSASRLRIFFKELSVDDSDLVLDVLGSMNLCICLGDLEPAWKLKRLIEDRKNSPIGKTAWTLLQWCTFAGFEDYDSLSRFRTLLPEIRYPLEPRNKLMEPSFSMLEQFADAISIKKGRYEKFAKARRLAEELSIDPEMLVKSTLEHEAILVFLEALEYLFRAADSESLAMLSSNLRHAIETLRICAAFERQDSPNRLILMKTELLEEMIRGNKDQVALLAKSIAVHPFVSENTSQLSRLSLDWANSKSGMVDAVLAALTHNGDSQSPWIRIAHRIMDETAKEAYSRVVRDRADLVAKPIATGGENYRKGKKMESLLQLRFMRGGYIVQPRLILEGVEIVDIFCYKRGRSRLEVACVDVKHTKKKYGPLEARDFASRVRELRENINLFLPSAQTDTVRMVAIVASASGISEKGNTVLKKQLKDIQLRILSKSMLANLLRTNSTSKGAPMSLGMR